MSRIQACAILSALLVTQVFSAAVEEYVLPRTVKICNRNDIDYSTCLRNAIQDSWMTFIHGIPKLDVPVLDPLEVDHAENHLEVGPFTGDVLFRDLKVYGLAKTRFLEVRPRITKDRISLEIDIEISKMFMECDYEARGTAGLFDVSGKGYFNSSITGVTDTWSLDGRIEQDRWIVEHFIIDSDIKGMKIYFTNELYQDKMLINSAMNIINENWEVFFKTMKPISEDLLDFHLTEFVNQKIFSKLPVSQIFP